MQLIPHDLRVLAMQAARFLLPLSAVAALAALVGIFVTGSNSE